LLAAVVAPPDPITQGLSAAGAFVVAVPAVYAVARLGERDTRPWVPEQSIGSCDSLPVVGRCRVRDTARESVISRVSSYQNIRIYGKD
jgi:hypothetical protein